MDGFIEVARQIAAECDRGAAVTVREKMPKLGKLVLPHRAGMELHGCVDPDSFGGKPCR